MTDNKPPHWLCPLLHRRSSSRRAARGVGIPWRGLRVNLHRVWADRPEPRPARALAAVRAGEKLVVSTFDRLARSVTGARDIAHGLAESGVRLALGSTVYDPADPMGRMFFNVLATSLSSKPT
nr:recombinase family protein [Pseudooceanicola sp. HF7]